jgi:hypothetical protein
VEALDIVDALFSQDVHGDLVLDTLGDGFLSEAPGQADDGVYDMPVGGAVGKVSDELVGSDLRRCEEPPVGIEPTTYALRVRCSGRLS